MENYYNSNKQPDESSYEVEAQIQKDFANMCYNFIYEYTKNNQASYDLENLRVTYRAPKILAITPPCTFYILENAHMEEEANNYVVLVRKYVWKSLFYFNFLYYQHNLSVYFTKIV